MDPYLEHPGLWPGVHRGLIANARAALNSLLPAPYIADIGERLYVVEPEMREVFSEILPEPVRTRLGVVGRPRRLRGRGT